MKKSPSTSFFGFGMPTVFLTASLICGSTLFAPPSLSAQEEDDAPIASFDGLVEVSEVFLDVLVTDGDGAVVEGLGLEDFIVEEDETSVDLTTLSYYTTRYEEEGASAEEIPWSRHFIFVFHTPWGVSFAREDILRQRLRASRSALEWVEKEMLPSDWIAVVGLSREMTIYQDFTQDPDRLRTALDRVASGRKPKAKTSRRDGRDYDLHILRRVQSDPRLRRQGSDVYDALGLLAEASAYLIGRKNMMVFTIGLGETGAPPAEDDPKTVRFETLLNDHNVAFYPVDLTPAGRGTIKSRQPELLERLADATGGVYHQDFVGFLGPMSTVADENYAYYLLTYQSTHPSGETGYRQVQVRMRDEGLTARVRRGYRYGL